MRRRHTAPIVLMLFVILAPSSAQAYDEPDLGANSIIVLAPYFQQGYWWDHTTLTVHIKAGGNVSPDAVQAAWDAVAVWNTAIAHRHGDLIQLIPVPDEPGAGAKADIVINLHAQGGALFGVANCRSGQKCQVSAWDKERANGASFNSYDLSYDELLSLAVHELGHALGVGHADPIFGTMDVMGYGTDTVLFPPAVISACDMDAFDAAWEWVFNGGVPYPPTVPVVTCVH